MPVQPDEVAAAIRQVRRGKKSASTQLMAVMIESMEPLYREFYAVCCEVGANGVLFTNEDMMRTMEARNHALSNIHIAQLTRHLADWGLLERVGGRKKPILYRVMKGLDDDV